MNEEWQEQLQQDFENGLITEQAMRDRIADMRSALSECSVSYVNRSTVNEDTQAA